MHILNRIKDIIDNAKYKTSIATVDSEHLTPANEITNQGT